MGAKPRYSFKGYRAPIVALALPLVLAGCGTLGTLADVANNPHSEVECTYKRGVGDMDSTEYEWDCRFKGALPPPDDGSPMGGVPAVAAF